MSTTPQSSTASRPLGLNTGNFRKVSERGFGDGHNSYAYCYAWYDNHAYVGTNRDILARIKMNRPFQMGVQIWPVPEISQEELRLPAQMWRYQVERQEWTKIYEAPVVEGIDGTPTPLAIGFRNLQIFHGKSDPRPCLYTLPMFGKNIRGPVVLRSEDGLHFDRTDTIQMGLGNENVGSFRGVIPFKNRLWIAASGTVGGDPNVSENSKVHFSDDPVTGVWEDSSLAAFGDPTNGSILDLAVFDDHLYAGTLNIRQGFQVWRTNGEGPAPHRWEKVLDLGADRGPHNQAVLCFAPYRDALYLGTAIQNGGYDQKNEVGPAPSEVIRIFPDGSWDLVVGEPRHTRQGFKSPTSGLNAGFDNPLNGYFWRMCAHDGALYVGTYDFSSFLPYISPRQLPEWVRSVFDDITMEQYLQMRGGCEVWRTTDGDNWVPITRNGFGNRFNYGIRTLLSTPHGLFVGTANPFGPRVAVKRGGVWHFEDNPRGGIEVWHGSPEFTGGGAHQRPGVVPLDLGADHGADALLHAFRTTDYDDSPTSPRRNPLVELATTLPDLIAPEDTVEEEVNKYFAHGPLRNAGYWRDSSATPQDACIELIAQLLGMQPRAATSNTAPAETILVIGSGPGEIAWHVLRRRPESTVTALVWDDVEAEQVRDTEPRATLLHVRPRRFRLPEAAFDVAFCVEESATVRRAELWTSLAKSVRPTGYLLAAELLPAAGLSRASGASGSERTRLLKAFETELRGAGFSQVHLLDITDHGWDRFQRHSQNFFNTKLLFHQIDEPWRDAVLARLPGGQSAVGAHVLACASHGAPVVEVFEEYSKDKAQQSKS